MIEYRFEEEIIMDTGKELIVLPHDCCRDLDDDCLKMSKARQLSCSRYDPAQGTCPFVAD